ncbi:MAG: restriction endonuclease subunit S [Niabella sp.]
MINDNLEQQAKTLYDYWFVQNADESWEVKTLSEIEPNIITGKTPSTRDEENFNGEIPFITIDDIRQQLFIYSTERTLSEKGANSQKSNFVEAGDICVSCIGTIGVIGFVGKRAQTNQQINSISKISKYNKFFLYYTLRNHFTSNTVAKKGAVLDNMNKGEFEQIPIRDADIKTKERYYNSVNSLFKRIELNLQENHQLSQLRDWLLPMLMNGQVSVR